MNNYILKNLQDLNLPANEARVYLALVELGQSSAGEIIKRADLHRSIVYESLDRLADKKLISKTIQKGIANFRPTDPDRILDRIKSQEDLAKETVLKLKKLLGDTGPEIIVYQGEGEYRRFWLESIERMPIGSTDFVCGTILGKWRKYMDYDLERYMKRRIEKKIIWKTIVFDKDETDLTLQKKHPDLHLYRLLPKHFTKEGNFNVLGDDTVVLHSVIEPMIIEIRNKSMAKVFKNIFDILWDFGKDIK